MTVALIDDDSAVLHSMRLLIESREIPVACYESAEAFLDDLPGSKPSCVVADVRMPGMTGLELQRELKQRHHEAPLILISGHADVSMAVQALKEGAFVLLNAVFLGMPKLGTIIWLKQDRLGVRFHEPLSVTELDGVRARA